MSRFFGRSAPFALLASPPIATAQTSDCAEGLTAQAIGTMEATIDGETRTLSFLSIEVEDPLFGDVDTMTSAAYVHDVDGWNRNFHLLSMAAYPAGYAERLAVTLCGEDVLEVMEAYEALGRADLPIGAVTIGVSPVGTALQGTMRAALARSGEDAAADALAAFDSFLPDRAGAVHLDIRIPNANPAQLATLRDVDDAEVRRFRTVSYRSRGSTPRPSSTMARFSLEASFYQVIREVPLIRKRPTATRIRLDWPGGERPATDD